MHGCVEPSGQSGTSKMRTEVLEVRSVVFNDTHSPQMMIAARATKVEAAKACTSWRGHGDDVGLSLSAVLFDDAFR